MAARRSASLAASSAYENNWELMPDILRNPYFHVHGAIHGFLARLADVMTTDIEMALARRDENAAGQALLAADRGRARALMDLLTAGKLLGQIPAHLVAKRTGFRV